MTIGEFDRRAIAAAVRATAAADHTGSPCVRAARAGRAALAEAGIEAVIATGTLVYRASVRDVLCVAHAWLEAGGDLIDFSSGGWMEEARDVEWLTGGAPAPAEWLAPPMYLWAPRAGVWRPTLELPPVGQAYYCPSGHRVANQGVPPELLNETLFRSVAHNRARARRLAG